MIRRRAKTRRSRADIAAVLFLVSTLASFDARPSRAADVDLEGLLESERNTIEVFRKAGGAVAFVTNKALRRDYFTTNISEVQRGTGSGFLWDADGHVVTNYHVIEGGQAFSITLSDGSLHEAQLIGVEPRKDLAVLHFDTTDLDLSALPLGRSDRLIVGQKVLAIGNPFGLDRTLTTGIISALGREIPAPGGFVIDDVIQTDASINPGNSGGPLLDSAGRLIGVNTAIFSPTGTSAGIGMAIPVDTVARIVPQLIRFGEVRRAGLGVTALTDHVARSWGFDGVIIRQVLPGSQAEKSGLLGIRFDRNGRLVSADVIQAIDGEKIHTFADLSNALDTRAPGEIVEVSVLRGTEKLTVPVTLSRLNR
jgi:S1-C subfamily serine protease